MPLHEQEHTQLRKLLAGDWNTLANSRSCLMMGNCQFSKHIISVSTVFDWVILLGSANLFTIVKNVMVIITHYCIRNDLAVSVPGRKNQVKSLLIQPLASSLNLC